MFPSPFQKTPAGPLASAMVKRLYHSLREGSITLSTTACPGLQFDLGDGFGIEGRRVLLAQDPIHGAVHAAAEVLQVDPPVGVRILLGLVDRETIPRPGAPEIAARIVVEGDGRQDQPLDEVLFFAEPFEPERLPGVVGLVEIAAVEQLDPFQEPRVMVHRRASPWRPTRRAAPV